MNCTWRRESGTGSHSCHYPVTLALAVHSSSCLPPQHTYSVKMPVNSKSKTPDSLHLESCTHGYVWNFNIDLSFLTSSYPKHLWYRSYYYSIVILICPWDNLICPALSQDLFQVLILKYPILEPNHLWKTNDIPVYPLRNALATESIHPFDWLPDVGSGWPHLAARSHLRPICAFHPRRQSQGLPSTAKTPYESP